MPFDAQAYADELSIFTLVLVRIAALAAIAPFFGSAEVPLRVRALLAVAISALVVPLELDKATAAPATTVPLSTTAFVIAAGAEALVGLTLGLGVLVLFSAVNVAGQMISQASGMQMAEVFDTGGETQLPVLSKLLFWVTLAVFVTIGGHRHVLAALLDTFEWMPAGQGMVTASVGSAMTSILSQSFVLGVRAAAPAMMALVLATLILGLAGRTLPQLNVMSLGFSLNTLVTLGAICLALGTAAWTFQEPLEPVLESLSDALRSPDTR